MLDAPSLLASIDWNSEIIAGVIATLLAGALATIGYVFKSRRDEKKRQLELKRKQNDEVVALCESYEVTAKEVARAMGLLYASSLVIQNINHPELRPIVPNGYQSQDPPDPFFWDNLDVREYETQRDESLEKLRRTLNEMLVQCDRIVAKSPTMGLAATKLFESFNRYKDKDINQLDAINAAIRNHDSIAEFQETVRAFKDTSAK